MPGQFAPVLGGLFTRFTQYDAKTNYLNVNNRISVGKGGILLIAYLDLNCNGKRDPDEPKAYGLKFHINGGRIEYINSDSTIRVLDLEPYISYLVELNPNSFDNIAWQIQKKTLNIAIAANQFTEVDIPISVVGEVSGLVYLKSERGEKEQGRIIVNLYNKDSINIARTLTDAGGFFNFTGLAPGPYFVMVDTDQLQKLRLTSFPRLQPLNILKNKDGDVVDGLKFILKAYPEKVVEPQNSEKPKKIISKHRKSYHKHKNQNKVRPTKSTKIFKTNSARKKTSVSVNRLAINRHATKSLPHANLKDNIRRKVQKKIHIKYGKQFHLHITQIHSKRHLINSKHKVQHRLVQSQRSKINHNAATKYSSTFLKSKPIQKHSIKVKHGLKHTRHHHKHRKVYKVPKVKQLKYAKSQSFHKDSIQNAKDSTKNKHQLYDTIKNSKYSPKTLLDWLHRKLKKTVIFSFTHSGNR